ncbi:MAG: cytochrome c oxidase subunit 3 [Saprospiraceae bacterium]|nr:cytochrome c oxidase subunit 3 [Saprospiraceae bacterium]
MQATVTNQIHTRNKIHPKKFGLLAACASITMMFGAFTSAFLVRQAAGNWLEFALPGIFTLSTVLIVASSITLHGAFIAFKKGALPLYKGLLIATFALGLSFVVVQYEGWQAMKDLLGLPLGTNPSSDFVYLISMIHAAHVVGGIAALLVAVIHAFTLTSGPTPTRKLRLELTLIYWHFVDILWVYLFVFMTLQS